MNRIEPSLLMQYIQLIKKSVLRSVLIVFIGFLASCSCSSNAPIRDLIIPEITSTTPSKNSKNAVINTFIHVTFSEQMLRKSFSTKTFQVYDKSDQQIAGKVSFAGTSATFKPINSLEKTSDYSVKISRLVKDLSGNQIVEDYIWHFITGTEQDESSPEVDEVSPSPYSINVPLNSNVSISLTELVSASSVDATSFLITDIDGNEVSGAFTIEKKNITFDPDENLVSDTKYVITLSTAIEDLSGNGLASEYITQFTSLKIIDGTPPLVNSVSPLNNAKDVPLNSNVIISFNENISPESVNDSSLILSDPVGQTIAGIYSVSGRNIIFEPSVSLSNDTQYTVTVTSNIRDLFENSLRTPFIWQFTSGNSEDTIGPSITFINPESNAINVANNNAITVTFSEEINPLSLTSNSMIVKANGKNIDAYLSYSGNTAIFRPKILLADTKLHSVEIRSTITDLVGNNLKENYTWEFTTGSAPDREIPSVTSVYPQELTTNAAINSAIVIRFSEPMNPVSINAKSFTIVDELGNQIVGVMKTIGATVTFRPLSILNFSTNYTATISEKATDLATNALKEPFSWRFTTSTEEDTTKPNIISTVPASASNFAPTNRGLIVTFSEVMDISTINGTTFFMTNTSGNLIPGNINYADDSVTFMPNENLNFSQSYIATISAEVADMSGNTLGLIHSWSFSTGTETDQRAPVVNSTSPGEGELAIANTIININFDKNMDVVSFNSANIQLRDSNNELVPGSLSGTNTRAIFTPSLLTGQNLAYDSNYSVIVTTGIRDLSRNHLAENYIWSFKTSLPPDLAPPFVVAVTPQNNQEKVKLTSSLSATFSEPINCNSVNNTNFILQNFILQNSLDDSPIAGTITCSGTLATLTPNTALATKSQYEVTLANSIQDMQGDGLTPTYNWTFFTAPWTQQFGSTSTDLGMAITVDANDNVLTTGITNGNLATINAGISDIFVTKHSKNSLLLWSKQFGSAGDDYINDITTDSAGNIYLSGYSYGDFVGDNNGGADIIIFKLDRNGNTLWKKQFGAIQDDVITSIQLDNNGDLLLGGYSLSNFDGNVSIGFQDIIVLKVTSQGDLTWSQQFGTFERDIINDIVVDGTNNIYITGYTNGDLQGSGNIGNEDIILVKLDSGGNTLWTNQIGTGENDQALTVDIDTNDNIYVGGFTLGSLDDKTNLGKSDQFVLKYDSDGTLIWSSQFGSDNDDRATGLTVDNNNNIILTGYTLGNIEGVNAGDFDLSVVKLTPNATIQWKQQIGTAKKDLSFGIRHDSNNNLYMVGHSQGALDGNKNAGLSDIIIVKVNENGEKQ